MVPETLQIRHNKSINQTGNSCVLKICKPSASWLFHRYVFKHPPPLHSSAVKCKIVRIKVATEIARWNDTAMKEKEDTKRPIDKVRDGAGSFELSTPDDDSAISGMITVNGRLLVVKGKGVYEIKLADQIDPDRTNIGTPNTIQRIFPFGSAHAWVGAVILTAHKLLNNNYLRKEIDCDKALALVLDIAEDISATHELAEKFLEEQEAVARSLDPKIKKDRSVMLPTLGNIVVKCNEFLQKSDHALRELFKLVKMFYPEVGPGGWESFKGILKFSSVSSGSTHRQIFLRKSCFSAH